MALRAIAPSRVGNSASTSLQKHVRRDFRRGILATGIMLSCIPASRMLQFKRITTQKRFIPQIDGLRFVAIASVVFFHIYAALERGAIPVPIAFNTDLAKRGVE